MAACTNYKVVNILGNLYTIIGHRTRVYLLVLRRSVEPSANLRLPSAFEPYRKGLDVPHDFVILKYIKISKCGNKPKQSTN